MMTQHEKQWIESSLERLYTGTVVGSDVAKVLRTISQIYARAADNYELKFPKESRDAQLV